MTDEHSPTIQSNSIGQRILIIGNSCSGKSTLGSQLAASLNVPFVELDALNWEPNWVGLNDTDPDELMRRIQKATVGDAWVVAGSYTKFSQQVFWSRLETIVWLDLPLYQLVWRMLKRSWHRWRTNELLWGTNYEKFWPQLMVWRKEESLLWWIVTQYQPKRQKMLVYHVDPRWSHIRFIRLCSSDEIKEFAHSVAPTAPTNHKQ
ncbi:MAG: adenylate kinase [Cyanobacteria bacterium P01_H01_bin.26]